MATGSAPYAGRSQTRRFSQRDVAAAPTGPADVRESASVLKRLAAG